MDFIQIGSMSVAAVQLAVAAAMVSSWLYARFQLDKPFAELWSNALFWVIAVWKGSVLLFQFPLVMEAPMSLLYFSGGKNGFLLGIAAALLYISFKKASARKTAKAWVAAVAMFPVLHAGLTGQWAVLPVIWTAGSVLYFFVEKDGVERALILLLFWQLLMLSAAGNLVSHAALVYGLVTVYLLTWRRKTT